MPNRSREAKSSRRRASQITNAHMPLKRVDTLGPPLGLGVEDDLGVGTTLERAAFSPQLFPQLEEVVDHPVEDDPERAVPGGHRLMSRGREVDDGKAAVTEGEVERMIAGGGEGREGDRRVGRVTPALGELPGPGVEQQVSLVVGSPPGERGGAARQSGAIDRGAIAIPKSQYAAHGARMIYKRAPPSQRLEGARHCFGRGLTTVVVGVARDGALDAMPCIARGVLGLFPGQPCGVLDVLPVALELGLDVIPLLANVPGV